MARFGWPLTILVRTSVRYLSGSTSFSLQVSISNAIVAQCQAPRSELCEDSIYGAFEIVVVELDAVIVSGYGNSRWYSKQMNDQTRVLVTGSDGFVGRHLVPYLAAKGYKVIAASRAKPTFETSNIVAVPLPDLSVPFDWQPLLQQCDIVIRLAGIAHRIARATISTIRSIIGRLRRSHKPPSVAA
jgi:hypothetical protein